MIQFLLSILGILLLIIVSVLAGIAIGAFLMLKGFEGKIEEADEYERAILKKMFDK